MVAVVILRDAAQPTRARLSPTAATPDFQCFASRLIQAGHQAIGSTPDFAVIVMARPAQDDDDLHRFFEQRGKLAFGELFHLANDGPNFRQDIRRSCIEMSERCGNGEQTIQVPGAATGLDHTTMLSGFAFQRDEDDADRSRAEDGQARCAAGQSFLSC